MPRYVAYLPIYATARFILEAEEPIPQDQLLERFLNNAEASGSICYQCSNDIESDFQIADDVEIQVEDIVIDRGNR